MDRTEDWKAHIARSASQDDRLIWIGLRTGRMSSLKKKEELKGNSFMDEKEIFPFSLFRVYDLFH